MAKQEPTKGDSFTRRALTVIALAAGAFLLWELRYALVLLFGAVLVATIIRAIAGPFKKHLRLPDALAVALSVLLIVGIVGGTGWLIGSQIPAQTEHLADALPKSVRLVDSSLSGLGFNHPVEIWLAHLRSDNSIIVSNFGGWLSSLTLVIASILILVFGGIFLAAQPRFYGIGAIKLIPPNGGS
jgi:predicted PurR-regulated permease PerM